MESDAQQQQQLSNAFRTLSPQAAQALQHPHAQSGGLAHALASQSTLDLRSLQDNDAVFQQEIQNLQDASNGQPFGSPTAFDRTNGQSLNQQPGGPLTPQHKAAGQFGLIIPGPSTPHQAVVKLQSDGDVFASPETPDNKGDGPMLGKIVPDPPDLAEWREKLFHVDEMITLSEEEFETYFPHVDNVYSHRSTQRYKRKPFISHYWDCRLKGRPPGTPKSEDPTKKKRKRTARERDLCDVKIKITEYYPGAMLHPEFATADHGHDVGGTGSTDGSGFFNPIPGAPPIPQQPFGILTANLPPNHPGANGQRYYTIQRVNGNGGNGKADGIPGPHKHTLEESDRIKKNSIQRFMLKKEKEDKKTQKTYHKKATGQALATVKKRSKDNELKLFGSCFCPFVQRVWIAMEVKGLSYQYIEVDPYKKPQSLLEVNPRGLVPAIRHGNWGCGESTVLLEYLEDMGIGNPLLPPGDPQLRANCRLWSDHINRNIVPAFYHLLQAQDFVKQVEHTNKLKEEIAKIVDASHPTGPFFIGPTICFVDVQFAPWMLRMSRVLKPYRAWPDPEPGSRWAAWLEAIEANEHVQATTSTDDLYLDSYERYAQNRPGTSQLADAVNGGYGLP